MEYVGVIGAGVMGTGVAQNLAETGHRVILIDLTDELLEKARGIIRRDLKTRALFRKSKEPFEPASAVMERITFTCDYERLSEATFVIENVVEKWKVKEEVYHHIDPICPKDCVFAANTSAISITQIGSATKRADRMAGIHFMNPVPLKPMVEVIRGYHTSEETLSRVRSLLTAMGKEGIVVNDMPGFVSNRVLMLTVNEAIFLVQDQVASAEDVDRIFKGCFGHKMGPLETADLIGLDTILFSLDVLYESYNDSKYRPSPLLKKMVSAGLHGRKSGRGFYNYEPSI
ncbi:MAG: 3-hydroxybutyryl-CoA dehydrogenase [Blastocatellia bacterium AA13]|nr:MAG: 3-hydroxybutyryl-CoA dehydrogenase [Blastocatellia bacterium AA13]